MVHLRVSAVPFMFLTTLSEDGILGGTSGGIFDNVCTLMNTTYEVNVPPDYGWGSCNETSCSGTFEAVENNLSDVALGPHSLLETYGQRFTPGDPFFFGQYNIVTGMPIAYAVDFGSVLRVLDKGMYALMLVMPWFVAALVLFFVFLENRRKSAEGEASEMLDFAVLVMSAYQTILSKSGQYYTKNAAGRLIVIAFIYTCLFLSILYSSFVKASMMNKPPTKRITYLRDLVKEENLIPLFPSGTFLTDLIKIQGEVSKDYLALHNLFERKGLLNSSLDVVSAPSTDKIFNGTGFAISNCDFFKYYFFHGWQQIPRANKGYYYCSRDYVVTFHATWYFNKNTVPRSFIEEFNRRTRWLSESPQRYIREYQLPQIPIWSRVYDTPLTEEKADPIALHDFLGSLFLYLGGLGLASGAFVIECILGFARRECRRFISHI